MFVANSSSIIAPYIPLEAARTIYGNPRGLISWGPPNQCKAIAAPGGYRITGQWHFSSGYRQANWIGAHAQVVEADGSLRLNRFGRPTVRTLLMPKEETVPIHDWNTLGMRGTASEGYSVNDVFVSEEFSGTREDPALRRDRGPLYAFTTQGLYAVGVAGVALGIARAMLDAFIALALEKAPRNLGRLADSPVVQSEFARREADVGAARAYLVEVLKEIWEGGRRHRTDRQRRTRQAEAWLHASHPRRGEHGRLGLQGGRDVGDLHRHAVRAALPRHPYAVAADPGARGAFRDRRPRPAERRSRRQLPRLRRRLLRLQPSSGQDGGAALVG